MAGGCTLTVLRRDWIFRPVLLGQLHQDWMVFLDGIFVYFRSERAHQEIYLRDVAPATRLEPASPGRCGRLLLYGCGREKESRLFRAVDWRDPGAQEQGGDSGDSRSGARPGLCGPGLGDHHSRGVEQALSGSTAAWTRQILLYYFGHRGERSGVQDRAHGYRQDQDYFSLPLVPRINYGFDRCDRRSATLRHETGGQDTR